MTTKLEQLIDRARSVSMTQEQKDQQRRSFAYGNAGFENPLITKEMVREQAKALELN